MNTNQDCDVCIQNHFRTKARAYCLHCTKYLCQGHATAHNTNPIFEEHTLLQEQKVSSTDVSCPNHPSETISVYCTNCQMAICTTCAMSIHDNHTKGILKHALVNKRQGMTHLVHEAEEKLLHVSGIKDVLMDKVVLVEDDYRETNGEIVRHYQRWKKSLNERYQNLQEEAALERDEHVKTLTNCTEELNNQMTKLETQTSLVKELLPSDLKVIKISGQFLEDYKQLIDSVDIEAVLHDEQVHGFRFAPSYDINIGAIEHVSHPTRALKMRHVNTELQRAQAQHNASPSSTATRHRDIASITQTDAQSDCKDREQIRQPSTVSNGTETCQGASEQAKETLGSYSSEWKTRGSNHNKELLNGGTSDKGGLRPDVNGDSMDGEMSESPLNGRTWGQKTSGKEMQSNHCSTTAGVGSTTTSTRASTTCVQTLQINNRQSQQPPANDQMLQINITKYQTMETQQTTNPRASLAPQNDHNGSTAEPSAHTSTSSPSSLHSFTSRVFSEDQPLKTDSHRDQKLNGSPRTESLSDHEYSSTWTRSGSMDGHHGIVGGDTVYGAHPHTTGSASTERMADRYSLMLPGDGHMIGKALYIVEPLLNEDDEKHTSEASSNCELEDDLQGDEVRIYIDKQFEGSKDHQQESDEGFLDGNGCSSVSSNLSPAGHNDVRCTLDLPQHDQGTYNSRSVNGFNYTEYGKHSDRGDQLSRNHMENSQASKCSQDKTEKTVELAITTAPENGQFETVESNPHEQIHKLAVEHRYGDGEAVKVDVCTHHHQTLPSSTRHRPSSMSSSVQCDSYSLMQNTSTQTDQVLFDRWLNGEGSTASSSTQSLVQLATEPLHVHVSNDVSSERRSTTYSQSLLTTGHMLSMQTKQNASTSSSWCSDTQPKIWLDHSMLTSETGPSIFSKTAFTDTSGLMARSSTATSTNVFDHLTTKNDPRVSPSKPPIGTQVNNASTSIQRRFHSGLEQSDQNSAISATVYSPRSTVNGRYTPDSFSPRRYSDRSLSSKTYQLPDLTPHSTITGHNTQQSGLSTPHSRDLHNTPSGLSTLHSRDLHNTPSALSTPHSRDLHNTWSSLSTPHSRDLYNTPSGLSTLHSRDLHNTPSGLSTPHSRDLHNTPSGLSTPHSSTDILNTASGLSTPRSRPDYVLRRWSSSTRSSITGDHTNNSTVAPVTSTSWTSPSRTNTSPTRPSVTSTSQSIPHKTSPRHTGDDSKDHWVKSTTSPRSNVDSVTSLDDSTMLVDHWQIVRQPRTTLPICELLPQLRSPSPGGLMDQTINRNCEEWTVTHLHPVYVDGRGFAEMPVFHQSDRPLLRHCIDYKKSLSVQMHALDLEHSYPLAVIFKNKHKLLVSQWGVRSRLSEQPYYNPTHTSMILYSLCEGRPVAVRTFQGTNPWALTNHHGIIYVTDNRATGRTVVKYADDGSPIGSWPAHMFNLPTGIAIMRNGNVVIGDSTSKQVVVFEELRTGEIRVKSVLGGGAVMGNSTLQDATTFKTPNFITTNVNGDIVVSDTEDNAVKVFTHQGQFLFQIDWFTKQDYLNKPMGVACSSDGYIYVADNLNNRVCKFDEMGHFIDIAIDEDHGDIYHPQGIALLGNQLAVVCTDIANNPKVKIFEINCPITEEHTSECSCDWLKLITE